MMRMMHSCRQPRIPLVLARWSLEFSFVCFYLFINRELASESVTQHNKQKSRRIWIVVELDREMKRYFYELWLYCR